MKYNKNTHNNSLWTKTMSSLMVFVFAVAHVFALPSIDATNLQTTAGVLANGTGRLLAVERTRLTPVSALNTRCLPQTLLC
jgi:hypothetical protein